MPTHSCRLNPALLSCTLIDYFSPWPADALLSVAELALASAEELQGCDTELRASITRLCMHIHASVGDAAARMFVELRRCYYITPKNYLELLSLYMRLLREKRCAVGWGV
jgi:dynein heavy chain, axonemal